MSPTNIRALLAADPDIGAGNVLTTRVRLGLGLDEPKVTFDTAADGRAAWEPWTVRELDRAVRARSAALRVLGVRPRDAVAVYVSTAADNVLSFFALSRLGAIPALVNPNLDGEKAAIYISRLKAVGLIADAAHVTALGGRDYGTPLLADPADLGSTADADSAPAPYAHWSGDPIAITHSSGTTGLPKAVVHSHESLYAAIKHRLSLPVPQGADAFSVPCHCRTRRR